MTESREELRSKLQEKLRDLFQFDVSDLDFGIYKILNHKRDEIKKFIEYDLLDKVQEKLAELSAGQREELEKQLQELKKDIPDKAFQEDGSISDEYRKFDEETVTKFENVKEQLAEVEVSEDLERTIYNDLYRFFARYYDDGDFLTQRRISSREPKYAIPYNGEEVMLHWANKDQYYIKTGEHFKDYKFQVGDITVWFRLEEAETEKDNIKESENRSFVLLSDPEKAIETNEEKDMLTLRLQYRALTDEETQKWLGVYNQVEKSRKTVDRHVLCVAYDEWLRKQLEGRWRNVLSYIPEGKDRTRLYTHLNRYTAKNTTDYFIHKNLEKFLKRELEFFLKNEVLQVGDVIDQSDEAPLRHSLLRMKVERDIAHTIINFLATIEDFQKKLFEKKKFVVDTHYCVTLDKVPEELYEKILDNERQLDHWEELYAMNKWSSELEWDGNWNKAFLEKYPHLMVDTRYFDADFTYALLASFDDLDKELGGLLVNGENFQGLNLLKNKFRRKVKSIYLDPPYNTEKDRDRGKFLYKDGFARASWLALMEDRIKLGKEFLDKQSTFFCSIDDNENYRLRELLDNIFSPENYLYELVWNLGTGTKAGHFTRSHEYIEAYASEKSGLPNFSTSEGGTITHGALKKISKANPASEITFPAGMEFEGDSAVFEGELGGSEKQIIKSDKMIFEEGKLAEPVTIEAGWAMRNQILSWIDGKETYDSKGQRVLRFYFNSQGILWYEKERTKVNPSTIISKKGNTKEGSNELESFFGFSPFDFPKPSQLLRYLINLVSEKDDDIFLDYFAGSGTTGHAVLSLNKDGGEKNYILMDMGKYFDTVLKPRIQKVIFSDNWKDGIPQDKDGQSHGFKYHTIESYEDSLSNIRFPSSGTGQQALELLGREEYMLHYMLDFETEGSPALLGNEAFEVPFEYKLKIQEGHETSEWKAVDLVETFHYLIGLWVQTIRRYEHQGRKYVVSTGEIRSEDDIETVCTIWRNIEGLDLGKEAKWVSEKIIGDKTFDRLYVNGGKNLIKDTEPIEITFRTAMFEEEV